MCDSRVAGATTRLTMCLHSSNVLRDPSEALSVTLSHDDRANENFNRTDVLKRHLTLPGSLVEPDSLTQLLFGHSTGSVDLVAQDQEGNTGELLDRKQSVELCTCFGKSLVVLRVNEEYDAVHLGEVVLPKSTCLLVSTEIVCGELDLANGELFRGWVQRGLQCSQAVVLEHVKKRLLWSEPEGASLYQSRGK